MFEPRRSRLEQIINAAAPAVMSALSGTRHFAERGGLNTGVAKRAAHSVTSRAADRISHAVRRGSPLERVARAMTPYRRGPSAMTIGLVGAAALAVGYFLFVDDPRKS